MAFRDVANQIPDEVLKNWLGVNLLGPKHEPRPSTHILHTYPKEVTPRPRKQKRRR